MTARSSRSRWWRAGLGHSAAASEAEPTGVGPGLVFRPMLLSFKSSHCLFQKLNRCKVSFLEIRHFLTTLSCITDLCFFFFLPCGLLSFWLEKKRGKKKEEKCVLSPSLLTPCDREE